MNEKPRKPVTLTGRRYPDDNRGNTSRSNDNDRSAYRSPSDTEMSMRSTYRTYDNDRPSRFQNDRSRPYGERQHGDRQPSERSSAPRQYGERNVERGGEGRRPSGEARTDQRGEQRTEQRKPHQRGAHQGRRPQREPVVAVPREIVDVENDSLSEGDGGDAAGQRRSRLYRMHMQTPTRKPREENSAPNPAPESSAENAEGKPVNAQRADETRIFGVNACRAVFKNRPDAIVRMYVAQNRLPQFTEIMKYCAEQRRAYHVIPEDELVNASGSEHHEGICMLIKRRAVMQDSEFLAQLPDDRECTLLVLENIGNPHNLGAILRSAAHFGVDAVFVNAGAAIHSGSTARVAEGGVEHVQLVEYNDIAELLENLRANLISVVATSSHESQNLYAAELPRRHAIFMGEENRGLTRFLLDNAGLRIGIPGTGKIESLNVSVAAGVILSEVSRRRPAPQYAEAPAAEDSLPSLALEAMEE